MVESRSFVGDLVNAYGVKADHTVLPATHTNHSSCGWQVKLYDPLAIGPYLSALEMRFMTKRYTNRRSLLFYSNYFMLTGAVCKSVAYQQHVWYGTEESETTNIFTDLITRTCWESMCQGKKVAAVKQNSVCCTYCIGRWLLTPRK